MKTYILLLISMLTILSASCKKNDTSIPVSGSITLSSQSVADGSSYAIYGFSFPAGAIHKFPEQQVDLLVLPLQTPASVVIGAVFSAPDYNTGTFNNTAYNQNLSLAENLFNSYSEVTATEFNPLSDTIKEGQIITYKTANNRYAKILVRSISIISEQYVEVNLSWQFQPNGSSKF